jgi:pseudaminic acid cytidylyltransferase
MNTICIIPARGGSKRIPRKNIKPFQGKPMIAHSIEVAKQSNVFDKIIVSTDDIEIAEIAKSYGAEIPFMRPQALSDDFTGTIDVIRHAVLACENFYQTAFDNVCCLYATAPFVEVKYLQQGKKILQATDCDFVIPVTSFPFPIQRAVKKDGNKIIPFSTENMQKRSQDLEEAYHDAGQFYWGTKDAWFASKEIWSQDISPIILPRYLVQDIDTLEDWRQAEIMYSTIKAQAREIA